MNVLVQQHYECHMGIEDCPRNFESSTGTLALTSLCAHCKLDGSAGALRSDIESVKGEVVVSRAPSNVSV